MKNILSNMIEAKAVNKTRKERMIAILIRKLAENQRKAYILLSLDLARVRSLVERGANDSAITLINRLLEDLKAGLK
jgi:hypothetical protein